MSSILLEELKKDKNITISRGLNGENPNVTIEPYNICLVDNMKYVLDTFKKVIASKKYICSELKTDVFTISISSYAIDGLQESNSLLATKNSEIHCIY